MNKAIGDFPYGFGLDQFRIKFNKYLCSTGITRNNSLKKEYMIQPLLQQESSLIWDRGLGA